MTELNTATPAASEQPVPDGPSQPSPVAESSPAPVGAVSTQEKAPEVDLEAIRQRVYEEARAKTRHEMDSEYGKKLSETKRAVQEKARLDREQLLAQLSDFVPDSQLATLREQYTARQAQQQQAEEVEQVKAELSAYKQQTEFQRLAAAAMVRAEKAGYNVSELPPEVRGDSPVGFNERFADFLTDEVAKLKKQVVKEAKKAAEDATRETERKLGVTTVSGSSPVGKGHSGMADLSEQLASAHSRGDKAKVAELRDAMYKEAGIGR
jgi:hypothetical protein